MDAPVPYGHSKCFATRPYLMSTYCGKYVSECLHPRLQNVLWDVLLTPEGSDRVPTHPRVLHDMIALLQENKIRKREVSISTYTIRYDQPQTSFLRAPPPREVYRISPGQLLCQTLLTRAPGNHLGTLHRNNHSKNALCENGST